MHQGDGSGGGERSRSSLSLHLHPTSRRMVRLRALVCEMPHLFAPAAHSSSPSRPHSAPLPCCGSCGGRHRLISVAALAQQAVVGVELGVRVRADSAGEAETSEVAGANGAADVAETAVGATAAEATAKRGEVRGNYC